MNRYQATVQTIYENKIKWAKALGEVISEYKNNQFLGEAINEALEIQETEKEIVENGEI